MASWSTFHPATLSRSNRRCSRQARAVSGIMIAAPGKSQDRASSGRFPAVSHFWARRGALETVEEYRVEMVCKSDAVKSVIAALKAAHPYEQPAYWVLRLEDF